MHVEKSCLHLHESREQAQNMTNVVAQACTLAPQFLDLE